MNRMRIRFQDSVLRAAAAAALVAIALLAGAVKAQAQVPLFDGLDWVMDRGANAFAPVAGTPAPGPSGIPLRQGTNAFNARVNNGAGNPDGASLLNNDPWHAVRRNVWPRT